MKVRCDTLIVGAGCAGLSLAAQLQARGCGGRVVLVDARTEYTRDRTWCYWPVARHPFEDAASHRWARWCVRGQGREVVRGWAALPYTQIPADAFYRAALARIQGDPRFDLRLGLRTETLVEREGQVIAETGAETFEACVAFDSRPTPETPAPAGHVRLVQHFVGHLVRAQAPAFSPETATLMDFEVPQGHGIHFLYVLPYDARHALVESTYISGRPLERGQYEEDIDRYLRERYRLRRWEVLFVERGALPMRSEPAVRRRGRVYRIGAAGGLAKPSTGYAFLAIQRFSQALVARMERAELPQPPSPRAAHSAFLDRVFLSYLERAPERAPGLFVRLFDRVPPATLIRFLSDAGSPADDLRVMAALPALPLAAEALRVARRG
jgi:lycopene beta-cyclase